jgi:anti-anti-sigma factor
MDQAVIESKPGSRAGVRIIRVAGPFTIKEVMDFQTLFRSGTEPVTIVDLSETQYLDSAALGAVISVHTSSQRNERKYAVTGVTDRLRTLMEMTGVADILNLIPTVAEAEAKLA